MHDFVTKKACNLSGPKNQTTSQDKKITQPPRTKRNHTTSWDKKSHATSRDKKNDATSQHKKKSCNLSGQENHKTSWDKKITQPLGTKQKKR